MHKHTSFTITATILLTAIITVTLYIVNAANAQADNATNATGGAAKNMTNTTGGAAKNMTNATGGAAKNMTNTTGGAAKNMSGVAPRTEVSSCVKVGNHEEC